jgi:hypothetical protein
MICAIPCGKVRRALREKGFREAEHGTGRDHEMYFLHVEEKKTAFFVKLSRGATQMRVDEIYTQFAQSNSACMRTVLTASSWRSGG